MNIDPLIAEAMKVAIGALAKEAVPATLAGGKKVLGWIREKLSGPAAGEAIAALEAAPDSRRAQNRLEEALFEAIEKRLELAEELKALLEEPDVRNAVTQTMTVSGNNSTGNQIAGNNNSVSFGRR